MSKRLVRWDHRLQRRKYIYLTLLADLLRIKPWQQDRQNQTKSNPEHFVWRRKINREKSRQKETDDKKVASKEHRRQEGTQKSERI